jgi:threonine aldolase
MITPAPSRLVVPCKKRAFVKLLLPVETNIIIIELDGSMTAPAFVEKMKEKDIIPYAITR